MTEAELLEVELVVEGLPGPQGSKKAVGRTKTGRAILRESSKKVAPWRDAVVAAALAAGHRPASPTFVVPVVATFEFSLPRGKTVRRPLPSVYPDLSKLLRATEDALTTAGVWADDALLVVSTISKDYAGDPGALPHSGVRIWIAPFSPGVSP